MASSPPHPSTAAACRRRTEVEGEAEGEGDAGAEAEGAGEEADGVGLGSSAYAGPAPNPASKSPLTRAADHQRTTSSPVIVPPEQRNARTMAWGYVNFAAPSRMLGQTQTGA